MKMNSFRSSSESDNEDKKIEDVKIKKGSDSSDSSYEEEPEVAEKKEDSMVEKQSAENKMASSVLTSQPPLLRRKRFIPKYEVEGVYKVVLSEDTQLLIEIVIGSHVNAQYPWKSVMKSKIMECIEVGGELCEFFPLKEQLEEYDAEEVLMGYIADESKDVDEFYICTTRESRDHCKQQSDRFIRRQEKKLEKAVQKKPRPWETLGSAQEIIELRPVNTRPLMEIEIQSTFPTLYEPLQFKVRDTSGVRDAFIELTSYRQKFNNVYRRRVDTASQAACAKLDRAAQTVLRYPKNMWTQSIADQLSAFDDSDGEYYFRDEDDDATTDSDDEEQQKQKKRRVIDEVGLAAYRAAFRRMRRPSFIKIFTDFLVNKNTEMESILELNTVIDIYSNDYSNLAAQKMVDIYDSMTFDEYVCFTDVRAKDKYISCAIFHPMWSGIVAICYSDGSPTVMKFLSTEPDPIQRAVYGLNPVMIWSHIDSLMPKLYLECQREVRVLSFCPFDENILIGGCVNGQVVLWDLTNKLENVEKMEVLSETREKYKIAMDAHMGWMKSVHDNAVVSATAASALVTSHYGAVTAIEWLSPYFIVSPTGKKWMAGSDLASSSNMTDKSSLMFFTGSEDGTILIWNLSVANTSFFESKKVKKSKRILRRPSGLMTDVSPYKILDRNLQPIYKIVLGVTGHPQRLPLQSFGMNSPLIKYIYTPSSTGRGRKYFTCEIMPQCEDDISMTLYCSSQHGEMRKITWEGHAFNTGEPVNSEYGDIQFKCSIHDGIITCTKKNPFINNIVLTVGGKIFSIWSDKLNNRPLLWKKRPCQLTDAVWSLYKPSLLLISTSEGNLETWDLLLRSDQPIAVQTLSGSMLTGVSLHTLPLAKNLIGVSDVNGSFRMFIDPPIFMIEKPSYKGRLEHLIFRELKVMKAFMQWQEDWMKNNPQILLEIKRKEGLLLIEKEEEKRRKKEEEEKRLEDEAEARRIQKMRVIGPAERWQMIIQKLIERTIAVKKRINRAELIEQEKPLRELEAQRLEKEGRMLEIMKSQKIIFNDTVAIFFPEAIKKPCKPKKTYLTGDSNSLKKEYIDDYFYLKEQALRTVKDNPYKVVFSWDATLAEGKERRQALNAHQDFIMMHKCRIDEEGTEPQSLPPYHIKKIKSADNKVSEEDVED